MVLNVIKVNEIVFYSHAMEQNAKVVVAFIGKFKVLLC
jgi:hypothetical protein